MAISLITAFDPNQVIGYKNQLPWYLPQDLKYFKQVTYGHTIVMGRKTYESIGKPLPNRNNIVVSSSLSLPPTPNLEVIQDPQTVLDLTDTSTPVFIIGGSSIYQYFLPYAQTLYITHIHQTFEGDCAFPDIPWEQWKLSSQTEPQIDNQISYHFAIYQKLPANNHA